MRFQKEKEKEKENKKTARRKEEDTEGKVASGGVADVDWSVAIVNSLASLRSTSTRETKEIKAKRGPGRCGRRRPSPRQGFFADGILDRHLWRILFDPTHRSRSSEVIERGRIAVNPEQIIMVTSVRTTQIAQVKSFLKLSCKDDNLMSSGLSTC